MLARTILCATALAGAIAHAQVCRISAAGLNQNRRVIGPTRAECPPSLHTPPFGNWGVTSNFGTKADGNQFQGWCHDSRICDNNGNCSTECRDGWYEWNSCTVNARWSPPNCSLFNAANCTRQATVTGVNVHGTRIVDVPVRCPTDTTGDGVADEGGCTEARVYRSGTNFMSVYELDPGTADELVQTIYYPEVVLNLSCTPWDCASSGSQWLQPSFFDSPSTPATVWAQLAVVVNSAVFVDTSRACPAATPALRIVSGASYLPRVAPQSIVAIFGQGLAQEIRTAPSPIPPTELGGTRVTITDAAGATHSTPLLFVSPGQINVLAPANIAIGDAGIAVTRTDNVRSSGTARFENVAPGLFTANGTGSGVASAAAVRVSPDGQQTQIPVFTCTPRCVALPIDLGSTSDTVYVSLYGTGIRRQTGSVTVTVGGVAAPVTWAGPQGQHPGMDQVNIVLPQSLRGRGLVQVVLRVGGTPSNVVTLRVQ